MFRRVPEEHFVICYSLEGIEIGAADRSWTWGICRNHDYSFFPVLILLWRMIWTIWSFSNSRITWGRMFQNDMLKFWWMMISLRVPEALSLFPLDILLIYLRKIMILHSISGQLKNITRLNSLLRNFVFVTRIPCILRKSLLTGPLFKRLWVNTVKLLP